MGKGSGNKSAKLALKDSKPVIKHNGVNTKFIDMSGINKYCPCGNQIAKNGFIKVYNNELYCSYACSDKVV